MALLLCPLLHSYHSKVFTASIFLYLSYCISFSYFSILPLFFLFFSSLMYIMYCTEMNKFGPHFVSSGLRPSSCLSQSSRSCTSRRNPLRFASHRHLSLAQPAHVLGTTRNLIAAFAILYTAASAGFLFVLDMASAV